MLCGNTRVRFSYVSIYCFGFRKEFRFYAKFNFVHGNAYRALCEAERVGTCVSTTFLNFCFSRQNELRENMWKSGRKRNAVLPLDGSVLLDAYMDHVIYDLSLVVTNRL